MNKILEELNKSYDEKESSMNITEAGRVIKIHEVPFPSALAPTILDIYVKNDKLHIAVEQEDE